MALYIDPKLEAAAKGIVNLGAPSTVPGTVVGVSRVGSTTPVPINLSSPTATTTTKPTTTVKSPTTAYQTSTPAKTFYRIGTDIYDASTNLKIGYNDWQNNWSGKATETNAPTLPAGMTQLTSADQISKYNIMGSLGNALYGTPKETNIDPGAGSATDVGGNTSTSGTSVIDTAPAYIQSINTQLENLQKDLDAKQAEADKQYKEATDKLEGMGTLDPLAEFNRYSETTGLSDMIKRLTDVQTKLTETNSMMEQELLAIQNKPILGSLIRGQQLIKLQEYAPQITMYQAQADLIGGNIDRAEKAFDRYYAWKVDVRNEELTRYTRLQELANQKIISLDADERNLINNKISLLEKAGAEEQAKKDKLINLMLNYSSAFSQAKISPADSYETAVAKIYPFISNSKQYGNGIVGEYQFYLDSLPKGEAPMSFNDYQNIDANRKARIASAGAAQTLNLEKFDQDKRLWVADLIQKLDDKTSMMTWGAAWDSARVAFPNLNNKEIDVMLGGGWNDETKQWWGRAAQSKTSK